MNQGATKSVSQSTIQRTLLRLGLRSRRLVRAPMLTAVHRRRRLEFARQYSSWTSTEWRQVAFSDESRFMLHRTDGRWRIRRETSERNHPATIAGTVQAGGGSIMVWGMFSWHSLGSLIIVEGTMDQYKYASVLADHVHPYMRIVFPQDDGIFQQDNARCHTAASVRAWFEEHQDEFTVLPWPANSPDLNPIEHLWDHLDQVVRAMDPQPRNLAQLATALESAWLNIPENTFRDLCDSLPARLAAVRSAKGASTEGSVHHEALRRTRIHEKRQHEAISASNAMVRRTTADPLFCTVASKEAVTMVIVLTVLGAADVVVLSTQTLAVLHSNKIPNLEFVTWL
ncbi:Transposable element Tcb1 transposase, partial [Stegodyphus mimosarum]